MARARTKTKANTSSETKTKTARLSHIKLQLRLLLDRTITISNTSLQKISTGIEKKIIGELHLDAEDEDGLCYARLSLEIDWNEYDRQLEVGNGFVEIESEDELELELLAALEAFNEVVECEELTVSWSVRYRQGVDHGWADKLLGFKNADPPKWAAPPIGNPHRLKRLGEVKVMLSLADTD